MVHKTSDHIKHLITLSVITISDFHCRKEKGQPFFVQDRILECQLMPSKQTVDNVKKFESKCKFMILYRIC
jgi:hypothetical protein